LASSRHFINRCHAKAACIVFWPMPMPQPITVVSSLLLEFSFTAPAAAPAGSVSPLLVTPERLAASVASLIGMIGVAAGALALLRARRSGVSAPVGNLAFFAGLVSVAVGGFVVATAKGGLGTGHGLAGGVLALVAGSLSVALAGLTRIYTRRAE
jgi:hypothetical protein